MPELPDIEVYCRALRERLAGRTIERLRMLNPFVLRTVEPGTSDFEGDTITAIERLGKRVVIATGNDHFVVIHLMIAGRLRWVDPNASKPARPPGKKASLARLDVAGGGSLYLTEAGTRRRASIHLVAGPRALLAMDPGGLDVQTSSLDAFASRIRLSNHTLKRTLTDPKILDGIGNAYSDEILHRAQLGPMLLSQKIDDITVQTLYESIRLVLHEWTERLDAQRQKTAGFPEKVTAFRPEMAVHGRFGQPCPVCGSPVQRIVYASNETNYCARCQTGGTILKDRALSRLLKDSWPARLEEC